MVSNLLDIPIFRDGWFQIWWMSPCLGKDYHCHSFPSFALDLKGIKYVTTTSITKWAAAAAENHHSWIFCHESSSQIDSTSETNRETNICIYVYIYIHLCIYICTYICVWSHQPVSYNTYCNLRRIMTRSANLACDMVVLWDQRYQDTSGTRSCQSLTSQGVKAQRSRKYLLQHLSFKNNNI